jgi:hypothetical protein
MVFDLELKNEQKLLEQRRGRTCLKITVRPEEQEHRKTGVRRPS